MLDDLLVEEGDAGVTFGTRKPITPPVPEPIYPAAPPRPPVPVAKAPPPKPPTPAATAELAALQRRIAQLETLVERNDKIISKLITALVDHGMADRTDFT